MRDAHPASRVTHHDMLSNKTIILGICGGIAAYKSAEIVSRLKDLGADVYVVMTKSAQEFIKPLTFRTLSGNSVTTDMFSEGILNTPVPHISLSEKADLLIIAPATGNIIGKIANGIGDDALSTYAMSTTCKKLIAPAMNNNMWENPIVQDNSKKLKSLGFIFCGPESGKLACGEEGIGRMSSPKDILNKIIELIGVPQDLAGKTVLVTAGGTREAIDPVRYISNSSSGKMGYAVAQAAANRGAQVALISANVSLPDIPHVNTVKVESATEMLDAVMKNYGEADIVVMAAAVADYRGKGQESRVKIKKNKEDINLKLEPTVDILETLSKQKSRKDKIIVGFALETEDLIENAKAKLKNKNLDIIVANDPSTFGADSAKVVMIDRRGKTKSLPALSKSEIAMRILDSIVFMIK